jgi:hypothetical protein
MPLSNSGQVSSSLYNHSMVQLDQLFNLVTMDLFFYPQIGGTDE